MRRCTRSRTARWSMRRPRAPRKTRRAGALDAQGRAAELEPELHGPGRRPPVGHGALLAPLAEDPHHLAVVVEVVDVEADQLPHPDARGVEQLEHGDVAQPDRAAVVGELRGRADEVGRLVGAQHGREGLVLLGRAQRGTGVGGARPVRCSQAVKTRAAVARRASVVRDLPSGLLLGQPGPQCPEVEVGDVRRSPAGRAWSSSDETSPR